jgi:ArsR family metal-binding transcriptional regulator
MILQQAMMKMSKTVDGVQGSTNKLVMLWKEIGLCVHKSAYSVNGAGYVISHFNSGKIVLSRIKTKEQVEDYLQKLIDVIKDWTFTLLQYEGIPDDNKKQIKVQVDALQQEIFVDNLPRLWGGVRHE